MPKKLLPFLLFLAFAACKSKTDQNTARSDSSKLSAQTQTLIKKFKPILQGVWVKADYVEKVFKTRSPLASIDKTMGITTMYINTKKIVGDSISLIAGYGNHDSGTVIVKFKPGKKPNTILFNNDDLSYSVANNDTSITISQWDDKKRQSIKVKYIKVLNTQPDDNLGMGLEYYINEGLIAGNYTLIDSTGIKKTISFNKDGIVTGFLNFKQYSINIDLNSDANDNLDEIGFNPYDKDHRSFSFKLIADTLKLYETTENSDSTELVLGKLKYKLIKQK